MIKLLEKVQQTIGVICLSIFFIAIVIQIITRHMGISVIWTEEVANYSFIWSVFMGAAVMLNKREHFSFDFFLLKLQGNSRAILLIIIDTIVLLFSVALFWYGAEAVKHFWNYNWNTLPFLKMGYVWITLPITGATMAIYAINHLFTSFKFLSGKEANV